MVTSFPPYWYQWVAICFGHKITYFLQACMFQFIRITLAYFPLQKTWTDGMNHWKVCGKCNMYANINILNCSMYYKWFIDDVSKLFGAYMKCLLRHGCAWTSRLSHSLNKRKTAVCTITKRNDCFHFLFCPVIKLDSSISWYAPCLWKKMIETSNYQSMCMQICPFCRIIQPNTEMVNFKRLPLEVNGI